MAAPLYQLNNLKPCICGLLPKILSQEMICEPGGSVETLEEPQAILTSLQAVHRVTGKIGYTLKSRERDEASCLP